ncbi:MULTISPECIES: type II toxin-antitoxin system toxin DNA ADP-ribosyl transferase DarT [unclassified Microcoleus]|uniref:type II toxin-antitoxin system toxin DNA ADP-ribosyl transferase DarT n=1 Tax=unclassified Microcoleus TaxID=2642155 RepID=UPI002FCF3337
MPIPIYHITHIDNLESIISQGGLFAYNVMFETQTNYTNIAYENIQYRRATTYVPCGEGGVLHDYVPFYFAPRSPMLYTISRGNVENYTQGQAAVIHLVSSIENIEAEDLSFVFTDGHAVMTFTDFFDDLNYLGAIDWDVMESLYWNDTNEDNDRKRRRQAEFLVRYFFPWQLITEIGVMSDTIKTQVENILQNFTHKPSVIVRNNWYY